MNYDDCHELMWGYLWGLWKYEVDGFPIYNDINDAIIRVYYGSK